MASSTPASPAPSDILSRLPQSERPPGRWT
ncbi:ORF6 [Porcine circovirus 2]|nr:ORF6 [Porcine circovirus 2]AAC59467.1 unknown [Porcine circovirus 2]AAD11933.1 ORF-6 [Bovine circovirus]ABP88946.1 P2 [Porcine circovirus 2 strain HB2]